MSENQQAWWREPTRGQWAAFSAAWVGWVLDAFDFTIFLLVGHEIGKEFGETPVALAGSVTLTLLVRLLGGVVAGWMADRWGRKLPLMLSLLWFAAFDAAVYFAPSFMWIVVLRTIFGFGMGAEWTAGTALAMESWPARSRGFASGMLQAGWPIGYLLAAVVTYFVVPTYGWRVMFLIAAVPALLVLPIRFMVPAEYGGKPVKHAASKGALADLMEPKVRRMLVLGSLVMGLGFLVYYGLVGSYGSMHAELGIADDLSLNVVIFNLGMLVGVVCAGAVANRWGIVTALVVPALAMVPCIPLFVGASPDLLPLGAFLGGALGVGYSGVTPVLTTSLFPEHVRARAIGIVYHVGAFIGALAPVLVAQLAQSGLGHQWSIALVAGSALILMSLAVLVLRRDIALPQTTTVTPPNGFAAGGEKLPAASAATALAPGVLDDSKAAARLHA